jgi:hypothetical protein
MTAGEDVTAIGWVPPRKAGDGPGEVTIEHRVINDVIAPMTQDDAGRLADRMFGNRKRKLPPKGNRVHWVRGASSPEKTDKP